ncbi:MAG: TIM-barrel domain-containing protein, partial [bacterium]
MKLRTYSILARLALVLLVSFSLSNTSAAESDHIIAIGNARFTVIAPECIRIEYSKYGKFIDAPSYFAVNRDAAYTDFELTEEEGSTTIDTGKIKLAYKPDGKEFHAGNLKALIKKGDVTVEWNPEMKNENNLGGTIRTVDGVMGPVDLGDGLLSRNGWYLLDDSRRHLLTEDWVEYRPKEAGTDWYLFGYGYDYRAGLKAMAAIGGEVPMPRKYSLGAWYSRYWPYTSKDYRMIVKEYENHDFPLDVMVLDMDWHRQGWTGWSWNRELLPDAAELLDWFHKQGLFVTLNVHPADGVGPHEDMYEAFMKDLGRDPSKKEWLPYDAGDKKYLDTLFKHTHTPHEEEGVDFWWLDWQQYPYTRSVPELTNLAWLNQYYYKHTGRNGLRGQSFSRWAGWGDHRHPIHFSGDADTGW